MRRRGYALGAEITGVDASKPLSQEDVAAIRKASNDNIAVYLPGQRLDARQMRDFCRNFGPLDIENASSTKAIRDTEAPEGLPQLPEVLVRANQALTMNGVKIRKASPADRWHSDYSYKPAPATLTFLLATDIPDVGGDTMFANMYMAYETLSPAYQRLIDALESVRDYSVGAASYDGSTPEQQAKSRELNPDVVHPLVTVHPETGRKALYVDAFVRNFVGMTPGESKPVITFLQAHATRYEAVYRHRWTVDDLLIWDNRCALHFAIQDYDHTQLRSTLRCSITGPKTGRFESDVPVAPELAAVH